MELWDDLRLFMSDQEQNREEQDNKNQDQWNEDQGPWLHERLSVPDAEKDERVRQWLKDINNQPVIHDPAEKCTLPSAIWSGSENSRNNVVLGPPLSTRKKTPPRRVVIEIRQPTSEGEEYHILAKDIDRSILLQFSSFARERLKKDINKLVLEDVKPEAVETLLGWMIRERDFRRFHPRKPGSRAHAIFYTDRMGISLVASTIEAAHSLSVPSAYGKLETQVYHDVHHKHTLDDALAVLVDTKEKGQHFAYDIFERAIVAVLRVVPTISVFNLVQTHEAMLPDSCVRAAASRVASMVWNEGQIDPSDRQDDNLIILQQDFPDLWQMLDENWETMRNPGDATDTGTIKIRKRRW